MPDEPHTKLSPVILALPLNGGGGLDGGTAGAAYATASRKRDVIIAKAHSSAGIMNFNNLLCASINERASEGATWMAMLHSDIIPEPWWLDVLIAEAEAYDADLMSAVVAIKDQRGLTSTAISNPANPWAPWMRITQTQVLHEDFPATFDIDAARAALANLPEGLRVATPPDAYLQVNMGCFVYRLDRPWVTQVWFDTRDEIRLGSNGRWDAVFEPEDWRFSRRVAELGGRVFATRKVKNIHKGGWDYHSDVKWGYKIDHDALNARRTLDSIVEFSEVDTPEELPVPVAAS